MLDNQFGVKYCIVELNVFLISELTLSVTMS